MIVADADRLFLPYAEVRDLIRDGDLALWRPTDAIGWLTAKYTGGPYSHCGSLSFANQVLETHDQLRSGGCTRNLSEAMRGHEGKVDVYRVVEPDFMVNLFCNRQRRRAGTRYNYWELLAVADQYFIPSINFPLRRKLSDVCRNKEPDAWERLWIIPIHKPAFCSQGVVSDLRAAMVGVAPLLAAWEVTPNMIPERAEYQFTIGML